MKESIKGAGQRMGEPLELTLEVLGLTCNSG